MGSPDLRMGTTRGRWVVAAAVLGSGVAFLDGTVVNAALPAISRDLHADLGDLQWVLTGYLLTLGSLLVLGGSLGDRYGRRRVFQLGLVGFAATSLLCAVAPDTGSLIAARCVQGAAAALLVPNSLAIVSASFHVDDRGRAIGAWSGLGGIATALGPFLGGWLIDSVSWRWVFVINLPLSAAAFAIAARHVPESRDEHAAAHLDVLGSALLTVGLAGFVYALIEGPGNGWGTLAVVAGIIGVAALVTWGVVELRRAHPMVPLSIFRSEQFSGANAVTFAVYAALGTVTFLLVVHLQTDLGYSALEAGASLLPITACMLLLSARAGALAQRIGPRIPMTVGPLVVALGMVLLGRVDPGTSYWATVFPGLLVLGLGLSLTVAPLTATVLGAVDDSHAGIASAINNSVARIAGLLAVAVLPAAAGLTAGQGLDLVDGFSRAMYIAAVLAAVGGVLSFFTIRRAAFVQPVAHADPAIPCYGPERDVAGSTA
ncbi:MAG TPA: MFS transporter [Acidimicrobiia bacterium]|jgi:EmrB/QacA subfamily drug resistance transporter|nr:MFS transporter [Acidimicrobiia bacterium]